MGHRPEDAGTRERGEHRTGVADQAHAIAGVAAGRDGVNGLDRRVAALLHQLEEQRGQQVREARLEARLDLRMHLPERYGAGLLPLLIVDEHRGEGGASPSSTVAARRYRSSGTHRRKHWYRWAQLSSVKLIWTSPSHRCWPVPDPRVTNRK